MVSRTSIRNADENDLLVSFVTEGQRAAFTEAFNQLDSDKDGIITQRELGIALINLNPGGFTHQEADAEAVEIIGKFDKHGLKGINLEDFIRLCASKTFANGMADDMKAFFKFFDINGDGFVGIEELRGSIRTLKQNCLVRGPYLEASRLLTEFGGDLR
jgi:Ca2+-binding EF-hand superfamily protein